METTQQSVSPQTQIDNFDARTVARHRSGRIWLTIFQISTLIGIIALSALLYNIINDVAGYAAIEYTVAPTLLTADGVPLREVSTEELVNIIRANVPAGIVRQLIRDQELEAYSTDELRDIIEFNVMKPRVRETWKLVPSVVRPNEVIAEAQEKYPEAFVEFRNWLTFDFITNPQNSDPMLAGIRTAILGSLYIIVIVILTAFPVGVGAAIYLQEYADTEKWYNRILQTNINNLAGVPSIIYGILGLAVFVRILEPLTSGAVFGAVETGASANGRTIISAGLTLSLLILPVIIINSQEAIKSVPNSLREAAYGLGATRWQTVWNHVLPNALPGILTGTIIAVSRAIGETAPLVVVGASTFITFDPDGIFSKFTAVPIQIYQWTARPQDIWRSLAAAAIIVLLVLLLSFNAIAIYLRNRYRRDW
ncbi:MAG: phosphate ABC transporter permease PstA [Anaerolineae bacterium]|nr:phosphate ABC transporter permease PstA [Anaerolineae bacterium]